MCRVEGVSCYPHSAGGTLAAVTALLLDAESGPVEEAPCAPQTAQPVTDGALGGRQEATAWDGSANVSAGAMTSADRSPTRYLVGGRHRKPALQAPMQRFNYSHVF